MALNKTYNLDEDVRESFRFTLKGHEYEFKQLTTEELDEFQKFVREKKNDTELRMYFYQFITPVSKDAPQFEDISKQMLTPHWKNFITMVKTEMGMDA